MYSIISTLIQDSQKSTRRMQPKFKFILHEFSRRLFPDFFFFFNFLELKMIYKFIVKPKLEIA